MNTMTRTSVALCLSLALCACAHRAPKAGLTDDDRLWVAKECNARFKDVDGYEWCRERLSEALVTAKARSASRYGPPSIWAERFGEGGGTPVYRADECVGPVVNGVCHGSILPKSAVPQRCYGTMLNGRCTGPQF